MTFNPRTLSDPIQFRLVQQVKCARADHDAGAQPGHAVGGRVPGGRASGALDDLVHLVGLEAVRFAMDLVEGKSLKEICASDGPLAPGR